MIKIENVKTYGWEQAIWSMRNPKNSWTATDSEFKYPSCTVCPHHDTMRCHYLGQCVVLGEKDLKLANTLANAGTDHGKFLRMIAVYMDITAPLYW